MLAALQVELVGGGGALAIFLAVLGPVLIASAAVIAAFVARKTANERQQEQLLHDSERQREQLEHDTARQERQLQHDREMRQKEHARAALDSAIELVQETYDALIDFEYDAEKCEEKRLEVKSGQTDTAVDISELFEKWQGFSDKNLEFHGAIARVMVRLGAGHEIPVKLQALHRAWADLENSIFIATTRNRSDEEREDAEQKKEVSRRNFSALLIACEEWLRFSTAPSLAEADSK